MIIETDRELKTNLINENMINIKKLITNSKPIFVELLGTPKSGKTTLLHSLDKIFYTNGIKFFSRQEVAEYIPLKQESKQYVLWITLELFKNLLEDFSNRLGQIIIYDRGIVDRLTWLEKRYEDGDISKNDLTKFKELYDIDLVKNDYKPIILGFLTSPELSIERKGCIGRYTNMTNLQSYNSILLSKEKEFTKLAFNYTLTNTDIYQNKIEDFILDNTLHLTNLIIKQLETL